MSFCTAILRNVREEISRDAISFSDMPTLETSCAAIPIWVGTQACTWFQIGLVPLPASLSRMCGCFRCQEGLGLVTLFFVGVQVEDSFS